MQEKGNIMTGNRGDLEIKIATTIDFKTLELQLDRFCKQKREINITINTSQAMQELKKLNTELDNVLAKQNRINRGLR
jgi:hypothetical protein